MNENNSVVAVYESHATAEVAIKELQRSGFDMKQLSIIGRDYHTDEHVVGYYNAGDRMKVWGKTGAFWGAIWGFLLGPAFFWIPGIGPLLVAGPMISWIIAGLESAITVGGMSAVGAGLCSIGIPKDSIVVYETQIKAGKFLLLANGSIDEVSRAKELLNVTKPMILEHHSAHATIMTR